MTQEVDVFKTKSYGDLIVTKYVNSKAVCVKFVATGYETAWHEKVPLSFKRWHNTTFY